LSKNKFSIESIKSSMTVILASTLLIYATAQSEYSFTTSFSA